MRPIIGPLTGALHLGASACGESAPSHLSAQPNMQSQPAGAATRTCNEKATAFARGYGSGASLAWAVAMRAPELLTWWNGTAPSVNGQRPQVDQISQLGLQPTDTVTVCIYDGSFSVQPPRPSGSTFGPVTEIAVDVMPDGHLRVDYMASAGAQPVPRPTP